MEGTPRARESAVAIAESTGGEKWWRKRVAAGGSRGVSPMVKEVGGALGSLPARGCRERVVKRSVTAVAETFCARRKGGRGAGRGVRLRLGVMEGVGVKEGVVEGEGVPGGVGGGVGVCEGVGVGVWVCVGVGVGGGVGVGEALGGVVALGVGEGEVEGVEEKEFVGV